MSTALAEMPRSAPAQQPVSVARTRNLKKSYGEIVALRNLNLELRAGELLALLGPNGAGKTTLVRMLLGLAARMRAASRCSAPILIGAGAAAAGRHAASGPRSGDAERCASISTCSRRTILRRCPWPRRCRSPGSLEIKDRPYGELSGGQKQRVLFGIAICGNPDLLFLDEPTVGLDVEARRLMWSQIRSLIARGKTVLLTTHYLNEADALADRILVLDKGAIMAEGTPAEIKARAMGKQIRCTSRLSLEEVRQIRRGAERQGRPQCIRAAGERRRAGGARAVAARRLARRPGSHQRRAGRSVPGADSEQQRRFEREKLTWLPQLFPLLCSAATLAVEDHGALRQRSEVRAAEEHAHSGLRDLDSGLSADVLRAVRHRAGAEQRRRPQRAMRPTCWRPWAALA